MPHHTATLAPAHRRRIDMGSIADVWYWCERLGCTPRELRAAVKTVGEQSADVRRRLR